MHATYRTTNPSYEKNKKFHAWNVELEPLEILLKSLKPDLIISALRGDFNAQLSAHFEIIHHLLQNDCKLIFLSSANVFDAFTNFPSYEYDKTLSMSIYGRFKIKIENTLMRLPNHKYAIARVPMVFGNKSPRIKELQKHYEYNELIEVFPNVVTNATTWNKVTQQIHYLINREKNGVFHLGSTDLTHHDDLILDICEKLGFENPRIKNVFDSNNDRFLAILAKDNPLPKNLQLSIQDVVEDSAVY